MSPFEIVTREKVRFPTSRGALSLEDLWDLPLSSSSGKPNLNDIAKGLHRQITEGREPTFVENTSAPRVPAGLQAGFDAVLRIIEVKQTENKAAAEARNKAEQKAQILELMQDKQNEELRGKSLDELRAMLENL